ncbi:7-carboxy-7-deazaguanine synthase [uncultured archaeon]|nr:7-carboxy-7-deazaguanine synthase [uncultured archaeon]
MKIKKTKFDSYCVNGFAKGCKYCVKGKKLVLFISGICEVNCWYCSLSKKRKDKNLIFANERECKTFDDVAREVRESRATSAGITGGDPLACLDRTIKFASQLKKEFGKKFHIHIYLPTKFTAREKLEKLSKCVDEVRFHPEFLINKSKMKEDIEKIKIAEKIFGRKNTGIELPMIPEKKKEILDFILSIEKFISFVNLNEFELSETNFDIVTKKYSLNEGGYVVSESLKSGKWILNELTKKKTKLKVHLCTAELKNCSQFANRLKRHKILPYGKKTKDGTVIYLVVNKKLDLKGTFYDEKKKRTILSEKVARKLIGKEKIKRVEEYPTYDRIEVEEEGI